MIVAVGSDHAGYELKEEIKKLVEQLKIKYRDYGTDSCEPVDYPEIAVKVAQAVSRKEAERGILICGSGIGMSMVANKIPGVRAALCTSEELARLSRSHNDANILVMGGRHTEKESAKKIVRTFLKTKFETGGRHERRVKKIHELTGN